MLTHPTPNESRRTRPCVSVCIHWTGGSYAGALAWCQNPEAKVSYHEIIGPNGEVATLVDPSRSAWAVGKGEAPAPWTGTACNSMTYNIALAGAPPKPVTTAQKQALTERIRAAFAVFKWPLTDTHRVTGHADWARPIGRKTDPWGQGWLNVHEVRASL
jgi:N-acetyl-anhydromuramyl-L-alanine amidase AmpD